jgi:hypothetical protein
VTHPVLSDLEGRLLYTSSRLSEALRATDDTPAGAVLGLIDASTLEPMLCDLLATIGFDFHRLPGGKTTMDATSICHNSIDRGTTAARAGIAVLRRLDSGARLGGDSLPVALGFLADARTEFREALGWLDRAVERMEAWA